MKVSKYSGLTTALFWTTPILICLAIHWLALKTWFRQDDFAWLGLHIEARETFHDWMKLLFEPRAQGTVRTLSERLYFLVFASIFNLHALPFRIWVFLTQFANLVLLQTIARRLTASMAAAWLAPVLWSANMALAIPLNWSSAYNEICCAFFVLLAFYFLLKAIDTERKRYWVLEWIAFLLGFGALETMVMYPAIAALYTWLFARRYFKRILWLFVPSILFTVAHFTLVKPSTDPVYAMHFDRSVFYTLWRYWAQTTGALRLNQIDWRPLWLGFALAVISLMACLALSARRPKFALFCGGWYVLMLLPLLPLTHHFSNYYPAVASIGVAMLAAAAVAWYPRIAVPLAAMYAIVSVSDIRVADHYFYEQAKLARNLVLGLEQRRSELQGKVVLLSGVDNERFWLSMADDPFRLIGIRAIFLTPGSESTIYPHAEWGGMRRFVITEEAALNSLEAHQAKVFQVTPGGIQDITGTYAALHELAYASAHPGFVDVANPACARRLGAGWYPIEQGFRWMGRRAEVRLDDPQRSARAIEVSGYAPVSILSHGPVTLTVSIANRSLGSVPLSAPGGPFDRSFPLPSGLKRADWPVTLNIDHTTNIAGRDLGLAFGTIRLE